jgi:transcriptional regulator GlxA family with amidase domain
MRGASATIKVAVVAYDGFNELDVFANFHILNRASRVVTSPTLTAELACASGTVRTMYGVQLTGCQPLSVARTADAVIVGSGGTLGAIEDASFMSELCLDPARQLVASQCSGALILAKLGLLRDQPACTDTKYRAHVEAAGTKVLEQPFFANGSVATAGGCLAAAYLSTWVLWRLLGSRVAEQTLTSVAPVGLESQYVAQVMAMVERHLPEHTA